MIDINGLLDNARQVCGAQSDSALARSLHVTRGAVSNWRTGVSLPDPVVCAKLADMTRNPLSLVLGIVGEARARTSDEKAVWRRLVHMTEKPAAA